VTKKDEEDQIKRRYKRRLTRRGVKALHEKIRGLNTGSS